MHTHCSNVVATSATRTRWPGLVLAGLLCLSSMSCQATSRRGDAAVAVTERGVCFSVSSRSEAAGERLKLFGMSVNDTTRPQADWQSLPSTLWSFAFNPPGSFAEIAAGDCIPYGMAPDGAIVKTPPLTLVPGHPYGVTIDARSWSGRHVPVVGGYSAVFCLVTAENGAMTAQVLTVSSAFERWKQDVCHDGDAR